VELARVRLILADGRAKSMMRLIIPPVVDAGDCWLFGFCC
jgi:hypothetical protein